MKFYSEITKELYENEKDLIAAEEATKAAEAKKAKAAKAKKADALKVEDAFKTCNAARKDYNTKVVNARKDYNEAVANAKKAYNEALSEAAQAKTTAEEAYDAVLKEFISKHPEGYHLTLKDGDNVVTLSSQNTMTEEYDLFKDWDNLLNYILKLK
jgi:hypothetical protein